MARCDLCGISLSPHEDHDTNPDAVAEPSGKLCDVCHYSKPVTQAITLKLWVSNQEEAGCPCDCTDAYLGGTGWKAPAGVMLDQQRQTLTGEAGATWAAYRSLAAAVAALGHGTSEGEEIPGAPTLTACPVDLVCPGYTSAAHALARCESPRCDTWAEFVAAIPALS